MVLVYIVCAGGVLDCLVFWQGLSLSACYPIEESTIYNYIHLKTFNRKRKRTRGILNTGNCKTLNRSTSK